MIVDYYYPEDWDDVGLPSLYTRTRNAKDGLQVKIISPDDEGYIPPHCWVPVGTNPRTQSRIKARYPGLEFRHDVNATGYDGIELMRVDVLNPAHLYDIMKEMKTYQAEFPYPDQYLFHTYSGADEFPTFEPRIWYFDMEWQPCEPHEGATTMIAIDDTGLPNGKMVFAWKDGVEDHSIDWVEREGGYFLNLYGSEDEMHDAFLDYLDSCDPDILIAHAITWADLPQLIGRLKDPDRLSPIGQVIRPRKNIGYKETAQPILGRLIFDTAPRWGTGTGLETLWQKSGKGQFRSKTLKNIAEELKLTEEFGEEGEKIDADVFTWWTENFDEFVDYCMRDTTLLRRCTEKLNAIPFFTTMQKVCGVRFQSAHNVTNYVRGLFSHRTTLKTPSLYNRQRGELTAAHVPPTKAGRWPGVGCFDFKSMYPQIIRDANLCPTTKRFEGGESIRSVPNGTHWDTSREGILPSVIKEMMELRENYKRLMKEAETEEERLQYDMLQLAVKVATNACYGYVSQRNVGGGWIDPDIGATITHYGRECINILLTESERLGYKALAGHTDSGYIQVPFDETEALIEHLNGVIQEKLDLPNMELEFEAYFDYWTTADVKNRNFGIIVWPEEKKGHLKVTGFAHKASSASPLTKEVHDLLFNLVSAGAEENEVTAAIRPIALSVINGEREVKELAPYGRIGKDKYERTPPNCVQAGYYYNDNMNPSEPFRTGDGVQWMYVKAVPDGMPYTKVVGFRNPDEIDDFIIDNFTATEKFIRSKIKRVYKVLGWESLDEACGMKMPKMHW